MANHSGISDKGMHFQIVPNIRKIVVPGNYNIIGTVGEHLSEQVTFQCPDYIDGHDIKNCSEHYVSWETENGDKGDDRLDLIEELDDALVYAWNIRGATTANAGVVSFSVHFKDVSAGGKDLYHFATTECKDCEILNCVNHDNGIYEHIYVDGNKLVFDNYTPVWDRKLALQSLGITPIGEINITANGSYDVGKYKTANVQVNHPEPVLKQTLTNDGQTVVVTLDGEEKTRLFLSSYTSIIGIFPSDIKKGVEILGVVGTYNPPVTETVISPRYEEITVKLVKQTYDDDFDVDFGRVIYCKAGTDEYISHLKHGAYDYGGRFTTVKGGLFLVEFGGSDIPLATVVATADDGTPIPEISRAVQALYDDDGGFFWSYGIFASQKDVTIQLVKKG